MAYFVWRESPQINPGPGQSCQFENQISTPRPEFCDTMPSFKSYTNANPTNYAFYYGLYEFSLSSMGQCYMYFNGMPIPLQDHCRISIHNSLNFITVCPTLTTSLIGTSLLNQQFWIKGNTLAPGVNVLNGPTYLHNAPFTVTPTFSAPKPKSTPRQPVPIPPDEPLSQYAYLIPQNTLSSVTLLEDISFPDVQQVYYTTLAIEVPDKQN